MQVKTEPAEIRSEHGLSGYGSWVRVHGFSTPRFSLHHHQLGGGVMATAISALFLTAGMFFRKQARRSDKR